MKSDSSIAVPECHFSLTDLNNEQRQAVSYLDGPCLVLAGAGSGKTRVITRKIAYLLDECAYAPDRVLALTFTNKAAREMQSRLTELLAARAHRGLRISTFHSLGLHLLRTHAKELGLKPSFSVLDSNDTLAIIQELLVTTDKARVRAVQQTISLWKNALLTTLEIEAIASSPTDEDAARLFPRYNATLAAYQSVDFDDLIRLPTELLERNDSVREHWQSQIHYLLVDEYQDTNASQYRLLRQLIGTRAMLTAVGDDDQAIYGWRGATVENLVQLTRDYPETKVIKLEQNYRSVQRILAAANSVIRQNTSLFGKTLWSELGVGEAIQVTPMDSDLAEAESIAVRLSAARFERQAHWRDFAVLYRSNHQARVIEQALRTWRIPYTVSGGQSYFDKAEIRDVLAYLRVLTNDEDDPAFIRAATTPRRGIGQATLQALGEFAARQGSSLFEAVSCIGPEDGLSARQLGRLHDFARLIEGIRTRALRCGAAQADESVQDLLSDLLASIRYEDYLYDVFDEKPAQKRWDNVQELITWLGRKAKEDQLSLFELVQHVALITLLDRKDEEDQDAVKLSTLHAAKGLEFPHVFLAGVEEGLLPHLGHEAQDEDTEALLEARAARVEEERRLMYVGITRAQRSLQLSWCRKRRRAREDVICQPSRFISEMGLNAQDHPESEDAAITPRARLDMLKGLLSS